MEATQLNTSIETMVETFDLEARDLRDFFRFLRSDEKRGEDEDAHYNRIRVLEILDNLANLKPHLVKVLGADEVEAMYYSADVNEIADYVGNGNFDWTPTEDEFFVQ